MKIVARSSPMNQLTVGRSYLLEGTVRKYRLPPGKRKSMAALLDDDCGKVTLRFYHIYKGITQSSKTRKSVSRFW